MLCRSAFNESHYAVAFRSEVTDSSGELDTLLLETVKVNNFELALELIQSSPDLAAKRLDSHGYTAVHYASKHGNLDAIEKILGLCVISDIENLFKHPPTPADVAREYGNTELEGFLSAIFPAATEAEGGIGSGETVRENVSNEKHSPRERSPSPPSLPEVDEEIDITGLGSNSVGSRVGGGGESQGGGLGALLANLHGLLGALQEAVEGVST